MFFLFEDGEVIDLFEWMWEGFDLWVEFLEMEVLYEWEECGIVLWIVRICVGWFGGNVVWLVVIYGFFKYVIDGFVFILGLV